MIAGAAVFVAALLALRMPFDGTAAQVMLHGPGLVYLVIPLVVAGVMVALRRPGALDIDEAGVGVTLFGRRWLYAWHDIALVVAERTNVRLVMGFDADIQDSNLNRIPAGFGLRPPALAQLIKDGKARWDHPDAGRRPARSVTPSQNAEAMRRKSSFWSFALVPALFGVVALVVVGGATIDWARTNRLRTAGVRVEADVVRIFTGVCGHGGCEARADYVFRPATGPFAGQTFHGYGTLAYNHWADDPNYRVARATGRAPIVYDPTQPSLSELNFRDRVFRRDVIGDTLGILAILAGVMVLIVGLLLVAARLAARRRAARGLGVSHGSARSAH